MGARFAPSPFGRPPHVPIEQTNISTLGVAIQTPGKTINLKHSRFDIHIKSRERVMGAMALKIRSVGNMLELPSWPNLCLGDDVVDESKKKAMNCKIGILSKVI